MLYRRTLTGGNQGAGMSKGGINTLTQQLALEYASKGIRANTILPGYMNTPFVVASLTETYSGDVDKMIKRGWIK